MPLPELGVAKLDVQISDKGQVATVAQLRIERLRASVTIPNDVQSLKTWCGDSKAAVFVALCRQQSAAAACARDHCSETSTAAERRRWRITMP
jgi:hypothetical protein